MSVSDIQMRNEDGTFQSIFPIAVEQGGTNATSADEALINLGAKDFVIAEGTSGDWKYRKWNSGIAECYGRFVRYTKINTPTSDSWYISSILYLDQYPFTFIDTPTLSYTAESGRIDEAHAYLCWVLVNPKGGRDWSNVPGVLLDDKKFPLGCFLSRPLAVTSNRDYTINAYVIGRWK